MNPIQKILQRKTSLSLTVSNQDFEKFALTPNASFKIIPEGKNIRIQKYQNIELNLSNFDKELLKYLVEESLKTQKSISDILREIITKILEDKRKNLKK